MCDWDYWACSLDFFFRCKNRRFKIISEMGLYARRFSLEGRWQLNEGLLTVDCRQRNRMFELVLVNKDVINYALCSWDGIGTLLWEVDYYFHYSVSVCNTLCYTQNQLLQSAKKSIHRNNGARKKNRNHIPFHSFCSFIPATIEQINCSFYES